MSVSVQANRRHARFDAVLFDRDGTLVHDVRYNGDPDQVVPTAGARAAVDRLRAAGYRLGVVRNQSGIGRGLLTAQQADEANARIDDLLGGCHTWHICPHAPEAGCRCRKPAPGLIEAAAAALGTIPQRCVVIGDIGPAHLAAAVRTPVVSLFAPTVPYSQWGPYHVPSMRLGQPCLNTIDPYSVVSAVEILARGHE